MRTAFLCCIHSNLPALEAVDRAIAQARPDRVICLGDVVGYGADPAACVDLVRARGWPTLQGNHEEAVCDPTIAEKWNPFARYALWYTVGALSSAQRAWVKGLPDHLVDDAFEGVHGSTAGIRARTYVLTAEAAQEAAAAAVKPVVVHGHTHVPMVFHGPSWTCSKEPVQELAPGVPVVIDVGSVGQPRDRDVRACWVLYDEAQRTLTYHRVPYDHQEACRRIKDVGLPARLGERLLDAV